MGIQDKNFTVDNTLSREYISNKFSSDTYIDRLIGHKSIDLTDNFTCVDYGNGYSELIPIDKNKIIREC